MSRQEAAEYEAQERKFKVEKPSSRIIVEGTANDNKKPPINDTGARTQYGANGAMREVVEGKGRYDLISPFMLDELAKWLELGAKKYADRNWEKGGIPISRYYDSALRHLVKSIMGMTDENHEAAVIFNIMAIIHFRALGIVDDDNMPHYLANDRHNGMVEV